MSSLMKYFGEQHEWHNGKLFYSKALNGVPFRGAFAPTLTQNELETQVEQQNDFHGEFFKLSEPDQNKRYHWVMDHIVNRQFIHHFIDRHVDHATGQVTVYIEWSQRYMQLSPHARDARSGVSYAFPDTNPGVNIPVGSHPLAGLQDPSIGI